MRHLTLIALALLSISSLALMTGCQGDKDTDEKSAKKDSDHKHPSDEKLFWPKKDIEYEGYVISLGHHGNHFHKGDELEPAVMVSNEDTEISDASITCQLMDGEKAIDEPAKMTFEPKTEDKPAHYCEGNLKFPEEEKTYQIHFVVELPNVEDPYEASIDVKCGH